MNTNTRPPIVEIRCAAERRGHSCGTKIGALYDTPHGLLLVVQRLQPTGIESFKAAKANGAPVPQGETEHHPPPVDDDPVLLDGDDPLPVDIWCPRHGQWEIDRAALRQAAGQARVERRKVTVGSAPTAN